MATTCAVEHGDRDRGAQSHFRWGILVLAVILFGACGSPQWTLVVYNNTYEELLFRVEETAGGHADFLFRPQEINMILDLVEPYEGVIVVVDPVDCREIEVFEVRSQTHTMLVYHERWPGFGRGFPPETGRELKEEQFFGCLGVSPNDDM